MKRWGKRSEDGENERKIKIREGSTQRTTQTKTERQRETAWIVIRVIELG